jgi:NAD(P)-dependent dehydrogenase (short-subunit alcohol dehydrogenase family)
MLHALLNQKSAITALLEGLLMCLILFNLSWMFGIAIVLALLIISPIRFIRGLIIKSPKQAYENPKTVFITGGARGIGLALAKDYIRHGAEVIIITDVHDDLLSTAAADLQQLHASLLSTRPTSNAATPSTSSTPCSQLTVVTKKLDVTDRQAMAESMVELDNLYRIDVVVANAGISPHHYASKLSYEEMCRLTMDINVTGVMNTVFPLKHAFRKRRQGQFIVLGSILSIEPIAVMPYPASKAWVKSFGRGLRQELSSDNVSVLTFLPGWVETNILSNLPEDMRFLMKVSPEVMSQRIHKAAVNDEGVAVFPISFAFGAIAVSTVLGPKLFDFTGWMRPKEGAADSDLTTYTPTPDRKTKVVVG